VQHHLDDVLVLVELVTFAPLAATHSPRASLDCGHLLRAILLLVTLVFPLAVTVVVMMPALARCRLGLPCSRPSLSKLRSGRGVSRCVLVCYRHEFGQGLRLSSVELVLHQGSVTSQNYGM
jgi:hypothetical protein